MTRDADTLTETVRDLRHQCSVPATPADVLDVVRELGPCSLTAIVRHLEARSHGWVLWQSFAGVVDDLVDADELVMRVVYGPHGRYVAYSLPSDHEGG